jgi:hypothetical protein
MTAHPLADMLRRDHEEWRALVAALDARPSGALHDPESPAWEAKDVYSHLARWITHSTGELDARLAGRTIPDPEGTDDEINARWQAEDAALTFAEARKRAQAAFDRRIAAIEGVPADRWDNPLIAVAHADCYDHYAGHRRNIVT